MDIVIRASIMFAFLYLLLRFLGKRELSEMTPFELVLLIVMGDLIQQGITHNDFSLTGAILAISTFSFWALVLNGLSFKFPYLERWLDGEPSVVIRHGRVLSENLRRNRMSRSELEGEMRLAGIAHVDEVDWAILEPEGKMSFIRKDGASTDNGAQQKEGPAT